MSVHKAEPLAHESGLSVDECVVCGDTIRLLPAGQGWVHSDGYKTAVTPKPYRPTHRSKHDGSEAMLVRVTAMVLRNENGDEWTDNADDWERL